jgi:signal transduction histidine kinase
VRRTGATWAVFALGMAAVLVGLGWVTRTALDLDRRERVTRRQADREESVRLALWRMDSAVTPLVAAEGARPAFVYQAFYPAERAYTGMYRVIQPGRVLIPSPLLTQRDPRVRLHFEIATVGKGRRMEVASPQVPFDANMNDVAEDAIVDGDVLARRSTDLEVLERLLRGVDLAPGLAAPPEGPAPTAMMAPGEPPRQSLDQLEDVPQQAAQGRGGQELNARRAQIRDNLQPPESARGDEQVGALAPVVVGDEILLARRVRVAGQERVQGVWLNREEITRWLLGQVQDLLPAATLTLVSSGGNGDDPRRLATLPMRLEPGAVPVADVATVSPIEVALVLAWGCVMLAGLGAAWLLRGAIALGDRRAAFVSAVTHELRTPLTTFRMYAELLAERMVEEGKRERYLGTLRREADRLGHLVENVLAYAGLERGGRSNGTEEIDVAETLERLRPGLEEVLARAGMTLEIRADDEARPAVRANRAALERIVENLVDNAAKYAAGAEDATVTVEVESRGDRVVLAVVDRGPGVGAADAARVFKPFRKSAADAAGTAPGVGLGLSLSRQLARRMGGDLRLVPTEVGARFELLLPG